MKQMTNYHNLKYELINAKRRDVVLCCSYLHCDLFYFTLAGERRSTWPLKKHSCCTGVLWKKWHVEQYDMPQIIDASAYLSRTRYGLARKAPDIDVSALRQQYACMICWVDMSVRIGLINNNWPFLLIQNLTRAFGWTWRGSNDSIRLNSYAASSVGTSAHQHGTPERNAQGACIGQNMISNMQDRITYIDKDSL